MAVLFAAGLAAVASAPSSSTLLPQAEQTIQPHVGVCVVGEAREFAVPSVRAGLRKFLSTLNNPVVHMKLFRQGTSSCAGSNTRINRNVCARMEAQRFNMSSSEIMSEFPMATLVELEDASSCKAAEVSQHACCQTYCNLTSTSDRLEHEGEAVLPPVEGSQPGGFLQYEWIRSCVSGLFNAHPSLSWAVRVRPDLFYLTHDGGLSSHLTPNVESDEIRPILPLKSNDLVHPRELWTLAGDWLMAVPHNANGLTFLDGLTSYTSSRCTNGDFSFACSSAVEYPVLKDTLEAQNAFETRPLDVAIARPAWQEERFCKNPAGLTAEQDRSCQAQQRLLVESEET